MSMRIRLDGSWVNGSETMSIPVLVFGGVSCSPASLVACIPTQPSLGDGTERVTGPECQGSPCTKAHVTAQPRTSTPTVSEMLSYGF